MQQAGVYEIEWCRPIRSLKVLAVEENPDSTEVDFELINFSKMKPALAAEFLCKSSIRMSGIEGAAIPGAQLKIRRLSIDMIENNPGRTLSTKSRFSARFSILRADWSCGNLINFQVAMLLFREGKEVGNGKFEAQCVTVSEMSYEQHLEEIDRNDNRTIITPNLLGSPICPGSWELRSEAMREAYWEGVKTTQTSTFAIIIAFLQASKEVISLPSVVISGFDLTFSPMADRGDLCTIDIDVELRDRRFSLINGCVIQQGSRIAHGNVWLR
ncbi:hypothetical protein [Rhodococcus erythropolis]|uniref:Uncharacterized protein n=1 Tax=Rhodococcus erythropolis TaxID=1833 RepID=A0AAX3ZZA1_RHOER|nr:hypothetical protein [Rhodococcus erythropolis]WMN01897.1 hypothetical protein QIE55_31855 [Rhodococcus erythropolis]WMN03183.1 hypothetical protein QIE55_32800 [Rhodococcus erythropolis]